MLVDKLIEKAVEGPRKRYHHVSALLKGSKGGSLCD